MNAENGDYYSYEFPSTLTGTVSVIFNNGSGVQYPGSGQAGLTMSNTAKKLFKKGALQALPESTPTLKVSLKATYDQLAVGQPITLKAAASNASGTVKYTFLANDGTTIRAAGTSNTVQCGNIIIEGGTIIATSINNSWNYGRMLKMVYTEPV